MSTTTFFDWLRHHFPSATQEHRLCFGRLLHGKEVERLSQELNGDALRPVGWVAVGQVSPDMWQLMLAAAPMDCDLHIAQWGNKFDAVVLTQTCGPWQHRFVVPLVGFSTLDWLEQLARERVSLSLSTADSPGEIIARADLTRQALDLDGLQADTRISDIKAFLFALTTLVHDSLTPSSAGNNDVLPQVCVTLTLADELADALELAARQGAFTQR